MAVQKMELSICTESFAIGLLVMLLDIPYKIISVKFLHLTYHDTEPSYYYKLCGVPCVEILSTLLYSTSYAAFYHMAQYINSRDVTTIWDNSE